MRPGVLIMYIYSYLYYDVTQVTIIKDYLLSFWSKLEKESTEGISLGLQRLSFIQEANT